jgi:hypothetical protein
VENYTTKLTNIGITYASCWADARFCEVTDDDVEDFYMGTGVGLSIGKKAIVADTSLGWEVYGIEGFSMAFWSGRDYL